MAISAMEAVDDRVPATMVETARAGGLRGCESGTGNEMLARFIQHASRRGLNRSCNTQL